MLTWKEFVSNQGNDLQMEKAVNFFLNVYDNMAEHEDPVAILGEELGDIDLAKKLLSAFQDVGDKNPELWMKMVMPEPGDVTLRQWLLSVMN